ncbi:MAG TPA: lysylphosphatidylglycerol synthase transmembrane domain-containing protein [Chloroflexia bacterium]|nr:lysylphosphatidylglycerol synthase transmembrane domain-containing protein [Chloroflexia bacterium]
MIRRTPINERTSLRERAEVNEARPGDPPETDPADRAAAEAESPAVADEAEAISQDKSWLEHRLRDPRTLLSFGLAIALFAFIFKGLNLDPGKVWTTMRQANLGFFLLGFGVYYAAFVLRGLRWQALLANVGFTHAKYPALPRLGGLIEIIYLSWFVNCVVPAKLGDAYRSYLLKQNAGVSFSRTIGTILAERMIDLFILFGLLLLSGFLTLQGHMPDIVTQVLGLGGVLIVALIAGLITLRVLGDRVLHYIPQRFRTMFTSFQHGTLQSFRRRSLPLLVGYTAIIWLMEGARLYWVVRSLDQGHLISLPVVIFIALASSLLTTLPFTPGGIGLVEGAVIAVLVTFKVDPATAASIALLDRLINYWSIVLGGFIVYLISRRK